MVSPVGSSAIGSSSTRSVPSGSRDVQHRVLLAGLAAGEERRARPATAAPTPTRPTAARAGVAASRVPAGQRVEVLAGQRVLRRRPRRGARVVGVLQPAVRVGDAVAVQVLDEVQALGVGVRARSRGPRLRHPVRWSAGPAPGRRSAPTNGALSRPTGRRRARAPGCRRAGWGTARAAPKTVRTGSTPAQRPPAAMSSSSSPGGPVRTFTLASARSSANTAVAASSRRSGSRACVPRAGGELLDDGVQRGQRSSGSVTSAGGAVHDRAAVVHRVVEHRARVDDPVDVGHGQADRRAVGDRAASPRRSSRAGRRCRRCGRSRWAARPGRRRGRAPRWQTSPASSTAYSSARSVRARSRSRVRVLRAVGGEASPLHASAAEVASWKGHFRPISEGHSWTCRRCRSTATPHARWPSSSPTRCARATAGGTLRAGDRLPSTRALAATLGVSRTVTAAAYDQLLAEGWVAGRRGSGTFVVGAPAGRAARVRAAAVARPGRPERAARRPDGRDARASRRWTGPAWRRAWRAAADPPPDVGAGPGGAGRRSGPPWSSTCCATAACRPTPADVLATAGSTVGGRRAGRARCPPAPGSPSRSRATSGRSPRCATAGSTRGAGPGGRAAGWWSTRCRPGWRRSTARPRTSTRWARGCRRRAGWRWWSGPAAEGFLVVEDDYDGELRYDVAPLPLLAALGPDVVVHLGTASKLLTPTLGAGWLVAPPAVRAAVLGRPRRAPAPGRRAPGSGCSPRSAAHGDLARHLRRLRRELAARRAAVVAAVTAAGLAVRGRRRGRARRGPAAGRRQPSGRSWPRRPRGGVGLDGLARHHAGTPRRRRNRPRVRRPDARRAGAGAAGGAEGPGRAMIATRWRRRTSSRTGGASEHRLDREC